VQDRPALADGKYDSCNAATPKCGCLCCMAEGGSEYRNALKHQQTGSGRVHWPQRSKMGFGREAHTLSGKQHTGTLCKGAGGAAPGTVTPLSPPPSTHTHTHTLRARQHVRASPKRDAFNSTMLQGMETIPLDTEALASTSYNHTRTHTSPIQSRGMITKQRKQRITSLGGRSVA
jgi:hypothetical protein